MRNEVTAGWEEQLWDPQNHLKPHQVHSSVPYPKHSALVQPATTQPEVRVGQVQGGKCHVVPAILGSSFSSSS